MAANSALGNIYFLNGRLYVGGGGYFSYYNYSNSGTYSAFGNGLTIDYNVPGRLWYRDPSNNAIAYRYDADNDLNISGYSGRLMASTSGRLYWGDPSNLWYKLADGYA